MSQEKNAQIEYHGSQISLYSDDRNDYVSLTDMARAHKGRKSIESWMRNKNTLLFLAAWEKYNNPNFLPHEFEGLVERSGKQHFNLSIKLWIETTNATGIFTRAGLMAGTFAHKDIAFKFASWLSAEFELFLINEVQRLKEIERKKESFELLTHEQVLGLIQLKEVFKYVTHQTIIEEAHKLVFAANSNSSNPYAEFNAWRNKILEIDPTTINERIKQYCIDRSIALTPALMKKSKHEKILLLDSYDAVRNAVWDFLQIRGEINALNLANLVGDMIRTEKGEVFRNNETDLFREKQNLGSFTDFQIRVGNMKEVKTARQLLEAKSEEKKRLLNSSSFDKSIDRALTYDPKKDKRNKDDYN